MKADADIPLGEFWRRRVRMALARQYFDGKRWKDEAHRAAYMVLVKLDYVFERLADPLTNR